jgi:hypothetical protein
MVCSRTDSVRRATTARHDWTCLHHRKVASPESSFGVALLCEMWPHRDRGSGHVPNQAATTVAAAAAGQVRPGHTPDGMTRGRLARGRSSRARGGSSADALTCAHRVALLVMLTHNCPGLIGEALCQLAGAPTRVRRRPNRLFASPSTEKCSTLRRNRIIPALTTTHGSPDQIPTTDSPRRHRTDGPPPWSTTRRRSGTSCRC